MEADSRAAAVFEVWHRRFFRPALLRWALRHQVAPEDLDEAVALLLPDESLSGDSRVDVSLVQSGLWDQDELRELVATTLEAAVGYMRSRLGDDRELWRWGRLHVAAPRHAIEILAPGNTSAWTLPEVERGGNGETVQATASGLDFRQTSGASFRMVLDVGDWDASVFINAPGQSGRPRDPHYSDHWRVWEQGKYLPMVFSRSAVEDACEARVILEKKGSYQADC
jgi:penicillin amidase